MRERLIDIGKKTFPALSQRSKSYRLFRGLFLRKLKYEFIVADITNNCNLRCPFCLNDFSRKSPNVFMSMETYKKVLRLLPLVDDAKFSLSCLYEPLLHPHFFQFLKMIPKWGRKKIFFTTNLTLPLSDGDLRDLSQSGINQIKISLDSFFPAMFERFRKGAKFSVFMDNLKRLTRIFEENPKAPQIYFITLALQANFSEIPSLVKRCADEFHASFHEIRYVYEAGHFSPEWKKDHLLSDARWAELLQFQQQTSYRVDVVPPPEIYFPDDGEFYSRSPEGERKPSPLPLALSIDSSGRVFLYGTDRHFPLNGLKRPLKFFSELRTSLE
jgi:MoaA/NifB/PqqE/SkfB family radical SAM enzyme